MVPSWRPPSSGRSVSRRAATPPTTRPPGQAAAAAQAQPRSSRSRSCPRTSATPTSTPATPAARRPSRSSAAPTPRSAPRPAAPTRRCSTSTPRRSSAPAGWSSPPTTPRPSATPSTRRARPAPRSSPSTPTPTRTCRDLFVNQATSEGIAKVQTDLVTKGIGDAGEIAILSASANATNQNAWIDMMKKDLAANHPNVKLVDVVYGDDDDQTSFDKTAALLQSHPNLKGIISPTTVGIAAAARYLSTSTVQGQGRAHRPRHPERDAGVRQGRHRQGLRPVEPGDLGYLGRLRGQGPGRRHDHRQGG